MDKKSWIGFLKIVSEKNTPFSVCIKAILLSHGVLMLKDYIEIKVIEPLVNPKYFEIAKWCNFIFHGFITIPILYWLFGFGNLTNKSQESDRK